MYFSVVSSVRVYWLMLSFNPVQVLIAAALCYSLILQNCDFFNFFFYKSQFITQPRGAGGSV